MRIVHHIPGRLRLRLPPEAAGDALAEAIQRVPGVRGSAWSPRTRGLLVLYRPEPAVDAAILEVVREHGAVDGNGMMDASPAAESAPTLGRTVISAFGEVDTRVRRVTRGTVGLGGLVPIALALWAARELLAGRAAPLGWSSALWYAHGLFRDYNAPPP